MEETRATETEAGATAGPPQPRYSADRGVDSGLWLVVLLLDDIGDHLGVRLVKPTVADLVSYERRQAWVRAFIDAVQAGVPPKRVCCDDPMWI